MKIKGETKPLLLSPGVFFAILAVSLMGFDFLDHPVDAARLCGASGYWAVVCAFALAALPLILLAGAMQRRFPNQNLLAAARQVLGRSAALVGNLIFLGTFAAWLAFAIRDSADFVLTYLLNRTPLWAVIVAFILGVGYVALNGLIPASRLASFVLIPTLAARFAMQLFALQGLEVTHIKPIFSAPPIAYLRGGMALASLFLPLATILLVHPLLTKPEKMKPVALGAASVALASFFLGSIGTIGIFGASFAQHFIWSELAQMQHIYSVFEQAGLIFVVIWLTMFCTATSLFLSVVARGLVQQFAGLNYRWTALGLAIAVGAASLAFPSAAYAHEAFTLMRRWAIVPAAGYPLLVFCIALLRGKKGNALAA